MGLTNKLDGILFTLLSNTVEHCGSMLSLQSWPCTRPNPHVYEPEAIGLLHK